MPTLATLFDRDALVAMLGAVLPKLAVALLVFLAFWVVLRLTRPALRRVLQRAQFDQALVGLLVDGLYKAAILLIGAVMAASQLGINVAAALAGLGVLGIAVGFAAQETVANMIAGFLIFWDRPFKVGDHITTQDRYGKVAEITMRTTRIRTLENTYVVIPNKRIIEDMMVNHSMYGKTRVNVPLGIAYKETIAEARKVLLEAMAPLTTIERDPAPAVVAMGLGDSSVNLEVRVWIDDAADERPVFHEVLEASKVALDRAGIEIPYPHLQLFVEQIEDRVWERAARFPGFGSAPGAAA